MRMKTLSLCAVISTLAGAPAGISLAEPPSQRQHETNREAATGAVNFERFDDFEGRDVYNHAGDTIATIEDVIVDRGSGQIMHIVVKTGQILGMGGKSVAIPYSAFSWDPADRRVQLSYTEDSLDDMAEFRADSWSGLLTEDSADKYDAAYKQLREEERAWQDDPYADAARSNPTLTLTGVVRSVERPYDNSDAPSILVVDTREQGNTKVVLGPAWYAMGHSASPERGENVTIRAFELPRAESRTYVARSVKTDRGEVTLRGDDGQAVWRSDTQRMSAGDGYIPFRYVLLSDVVGRDCEARYEECGEVQHAIIECTTGQVAFLAIDPNENFMGIGDDLHLVPWSVSRVFNEVVQLDASKEMITNSRVMDDDLRTLENRSTWNAAYKAFEVKSPEFKKSSMKHSDSATHKHGKNWWDRGDLGSVMTRGAGEKISGAYMKSGTSDFGDASDRLATVVVSTPGGQREIAVAPQWYLTERQVAFSNGDRLEIETVRAVIDGESVWIAKSITHNGNTHTLWNADRPAWADKK